MKHAIKMVLVPASSSLLPPEDRLLSDLDDQIYQVLNNIKLNENEKIKLYNQILHRYLTVNAQKKRKREHQNEVEQKTEERVRVAEVKNLNSKTITTKFEEPQIHSIQYNPTTEQLTTKWINF